MVRARNESQIHHNMLLSRRMSTTAPCALRNAMCRLRLRLRLHSSCFVIAPRARSFHHGPETILPSLISTSSPQFLEKAEAMDKLVTDLDTHLATARLGGGIPALDKMRSRGKKTPRERLSLLLDKETPFLELSSLAAHNVYEGHHAPGASLITGIGRIAGRECMIIIND